MSASPDWPPHRTVARLPGSLPMGSVVEDTPIHAFETPAPRLSGRLNMYRYDDGDVFNRHTDGDWHDFDLSDDRREMPQWAGLRSCLTMLVYLNGPDDGAQGGQTRLFRRDGSHHDVTPAYVPG